MMTGISAKQSIQLKITMLMVALVLVSSVGFGALIATSLSTLSEKQIETSEQELKQSVIKTMQGSGQLAGEKVARLLTQSFAPALQFANMLSNTAHPNSPLARQQVRDLAKYSLESSPTISSLYAQFEPNGYDNLDSENVGGTTHSTPVGTLEVYWIRENGQPVYYPTENAQEKYLSERDENGVREAEWYLCSMESLKPCALDPYLYEIEPGNEQLMTTLAAPIIVGNRFRGLVGVDINLPIVQSWIEEQAKQLFDGNSNITLLSQRNIVVASSQYPKLVAKSISGLDLPITDFVSTNQDLTLDNEQWFIKVPIPISEAEVSWTLVVSVPKSIAMASILRMTEAADDTYQGTLWQTILFALAFLVIGSLVSILLARSISNPIKLVSNVIQDLADQDGDLTTQVAVEKHKELIDLAGGLNRFIAKLAEMIRASKRSSGELVEKFSRLDGISKSVETDTANQQQELDNIATAMTQMASTANEVAKIASDTAAGSASATQLLEETQSILRQNVEEVQKLEGEMSATSQQVSQVAESTSDITSIIETIQSIAEQTNLLALNAAIEAARAGEQGRGFAVVADEVRSLAGRTQASTQDISNLINNLQKDVALAVETISAIQASVVDSVDKAQGSFSRLSDSMLSIRQISEGSEQVATAAEEQSQVSEDINRRLVRITESSRALADLGAELKETNAGSQVLLTNMDSQLSRLKC
jgi:methyl-accepting chemotaxis protein